jgi:capsular exopolysaccharide synthesis family protein
VERSSDRPNFERGVDLLRRRGLWILPCFVLAAGAAYAYSKHQTIKYTATASLIFKSDQLTQQLAGLPTNITSAQAEQNGDAKLVQLGNTAATTAARLGQGLTDQKVSESLSVAQQGETDVIGESSVVDVSASVTSPALAAEIANTYAEQFVEGQQKANDLYFTAALATVNKQLAALSPKQRLAPSGVVLEERAQELKLLAALQYGSVQLSRRATTPTSPSSPKTLRNVLIGGVMGLLIGLGLVLLLEHLDPRVRDSEELERLYHTPLLGAVPESASLSQFKRDALALALPATEAEAFNMLLARLRSFHPHRDLRTILVTSAAPGEGTTTISLYLAIAAARSGSRTLLLDLDLRRRILASRLGIPVGPGLTDVLTDVASVEDVTRSIDLTASTRNGIVGPTLHVLAAGTEKSSSPVELIKTSTMERLLETTRSTYDLVIVDTPSPMAVSDVFPVLRLADGVVIVSRIGHDRKDMAERLREVLDRSGSPLLGVVANCVKSIGRGVPSRDYLDVRNPALDGVLSTDEQRSTTRT